MSTLTFQSTQSTQSTFHVTLTARWFFVSALAAILMIQTACATSAPSVLPPTNSLLPPSDILQQWDGTWTMNEATSLASYLDCCEGPGENIPLTPRARKLREDYAAISFESSEMNKDANLTHCMSPGIPGMFRHPMFFAFTWAPGRVQITYQSGSIRQIWTDGRSFSERLVPKAMGTSIGHWEGSTLVVETRGISRRSEIMLMGPLRPSPQTKVTERLTVHEGSIETVSAPDYVYNSTGPVKKYLHLHTAVEDPEMFFEPFTYDSYFVNVPVSLNTGFGCKANNRSVGDSPVDLTPPEDD